MFCHAWVVFVQISLVLFARKRACFVCVQESYGMSTPRMLAKGVALPRGQHAERGGLAEGVALPRGWPCQGGGLPYQGWTFLSVLSCPHLGRRCRGWPYVQDRKNFGQ